ncbi:MAG: DUF309 domain-containing protein [Candidatus Binatia bacterium]
MASSSLPLPLRNALAALAVAALDDPAAARALAWLADRASVPPPDAAARLAAVHLVDLGALTLLAVHTPHAEAAAAHARCALAAVAAYRAPAGSDPVRRAVHQAAALWNARLFFEVHEVLEAVWKDAKGDVRQALQGLIQIGVAFYQLANGNLLGARTLMAEGRAHLTAVPPATLPALDAAALLGTTGAWDTELSAGNAPTDAPPAFPLRPDAA